MVLYTVVITTTLLSGLIPARPSSFESALTLDATRYPLLSADAACCATVVLTYRMVFQEILRISRDSGRMMSRAACTIKVGGGVSGPRPFSPAAVDLCDAGIGVCDAGLEGGEADNHRGDAAVRLTSMTPQTRSSHTGSKGPQRDLNCARNCWYFPPH